MTQHTPKFIVQRTSIHGESLLQFGGVEAMFATRSVQLPTEYAEFIALACNAYDSNQAIIAALLAAAKAAQAHTEELAEAWRKGALHENDGLGGTRSNRNWALDVQLRAAIAQAEVKP